MLIGNKENDTGFLLFLCTTNTHNKRPQLSTAAFVFLFMIRRSESAPVGEEPAPPVIFPDSCHNLIACKDANNFLLHLLQVRLFFQQITNFPEKNDLITGWRGSGGSCRSFFLLLQAVHGFDDKEDTEGYNQEVNQGLYEHPVVD